MSTAKESLKKHDKEKRLEEEARIVEVAKDPENSLEVQAWIVKETIDNGRILRELVSDLTDLIAQMGRFQTTEVCEHQFQKCEVIADTVKNHKPLADEPAKGFVKLKAGHISIVGGSAFGITASICFTLLKWFGKI